MQVDCEVGEANAQGLRGMHNAPAPGDCGTGGVHLHNFQRLSFCLHAMQVDCEVGEVNAQGLRGVRAKRDMQLHQVAVKLPGVMAITLKEWNQTSEVWDLGVSPSDHVHRLCNTS